MKILLFWEYYDIYLRTFYARYPEVASLPYGQQLNRILDDYFSWPPALGRRLGEAGHDVATVIANAEPLQRAWAKENGVEFNATDWQFSLPVAQVRRFRPDVLWFGPMFQYYGTYLQDLKPFCRRIFAWISCPLPSRLDLSAIDCVLTSHANLLQTFRREGKPCEQLLPAFEPRIWDLLRQEKQEIPVSFVGGLSAAHIRRKQILEEIARKLPIQVWGYGIQGPPPVGGVRSLWKRIRFHRHASPLAGRYRGKAWGMEMYRILRRSLMTINVHGEVAEGLAGNMRMFEATGVGTVLLTEEAPNLADLFIQNAEVVAFHDSDDLVKKIKYYLEDDQARQSIAAAGQRRTLTDHNTVKRSQELLAIFEQFCRC